MARNTINRAPGKGPRKGVVIFGLLAVLGGGVYHFAKTPPKTSANASAPASASNPQPAAANYTSTLPDLEVNWKGGMTRDPFDTRELTPRIEALIPKVEPQGPDPRQVAAAEAKASIRVQGILNGESRSALINGSMYHAGERIKGFTIVEIQDNQIIVERQGVLLSIMSE